MAKTLKDVSDSFDEQFIKVKSDKTRSGFALMCDPEFAKEFIQEEVKSLVESLRMEDKNFSKIPKKERLKMDDGDIGFMHGWNDAVDRINKHLDNLLSKGEI